MAHRLRAGTDHDRQRDVEPHDLQTDRLMLRARVRAELEHLAEHRDRPPLPARQDRERTQRGTHRVRVRVVRVVDDRHAVRAFDDVHPMRADRVGAREPADDEVCRQPDRECRSRRRKRVVDVMLADQPQTHDRLVARPVAARGGHRERCPTGAVQVHVTGLHVGVRRLAEREHRAGCRCGHRGDALVIGVEHRDAVGT